MPKKTETTTAAALTAEDAIKGLITALGADIEKTANVDVRLIPASGTARVRLLGNDRSMRTHRVKIEFPKEDEKGEKGD